MWWVSNRVTPDSVKTFYSEFLRLFWTDFLSDRQVFWVTYTFVGVSCSNSNNNNSHIEHCTHTSDITNIKYKTFFSFSRRCSYLWVLACSMIRLLSLSLSLFFFMINFHNFCILFYIIFWRCFRCLQTLPTLFYVQNIQHGEYGITCTIKPLNSCNTIYPRNIVYFRCVIVNTLIFFSYSWLQVLRWFLFCL
jgi:hypothetical protein